MGTKNLHLISTLVILFCCSVLGNLRAQIKDNLTYLVENVSEGKTYYLTTANSKSKQVVEEENGYYIKTIPAKYRVVYDTIQLSPALNGNLDTSNYFIETEVLILKEPSAEWKTANVSKLCLESGEAPHASLCLLKMVPKYQIINKKFFPFKNILDVDDTDFIIPAKTVVVQREELEEKAKLERLPLTDVPPSLKAGERLIRVPAGKWQAWEEVVCPYGEFNDPKMEDIQSALKKQGYEVQLTGKYDEQTRTHIHEFQTDHMLEIGELSEETIKRLGVKRERLITIEY